MNAETFFERLWEDYIAMAPRAAQLRQVFLDRGEQVVNDHVAFRTLDLAPIRIEDLEPLILELGYRRFAPYEFTEKRLRAWSYSHSTPGLPRIFLSELKTAEFPEEIQIELRALAAQVDPARVRTHDVFWAGRLWAPSTVATWERLVAVSEYAAWVCALGLRPNHFTISINALTQTRTVEEVNQVVEAAGARISEAGGRVKGTPASLLEQSSTIADRMEVAFAAGETRVVPTCYYEFALRHALPSGELFDGFVSENANRIFESTYTSNQK